MPILLLVCTQGRHCKHHACTLVELWCNQHHYQVHVNESKIFLLWPNQVKPDLNQQHHNSRISLTTDWTSSSWKASCYRLKVILKSNCKHVPADGVVHTEDKWGIRQCFTYRGGDRKKCNRHRFKVFKFSFYVMKCNWQPYSTSNQFLVISKRYLDCFLAEQ